MDGRLIVQLDGQMGGWDGGWLMEWIASWVEKMVGWQKIGFDGWVIGYRVTWVVG